MTWLSVVVAFAVGVVVGSVVAASVAVLLAGAAVEGDSDE